MANNNATLVTTGKPKLSGAIFRAPLGTPLPTKADDVLDPAFVCLGYASEDGVENLNEMNVSAIKAWGGMIVYRSLDELTDNFVFKLIESENIEVKKTVYGDSNVTVDSDGNAHVEVKADDPQEAVWVFLMALRGNVEQMIVIADGAITSRESIKYNDSDPVAYGVTVSAYPDTNGKTHDEYYKGLATPTPSI